MGESEEELEAGGKGQMSSLDGSAGKERKSTGRVHRIFSPFRLNLSEAGLDLWMPLMPFFAAEKYQKPTIPHL